GMDLGARLKQPQPDNPIAPTPVAKSKNAVACPLMLQERQDQRTSAFAPGAEENRGSDSCADFVRGPAPYAAHCPKPWPCARSRNHGGEQDSAWAPTLNSNPRADNLFVFNRRRGKTQCWG